MLDTFTTRAAAAFFSDGSSAFVNITTANTFASNDARRLSSRVSLVVFCVQPFSSITPALFTSTSSAPNSRSTSRATASISLCRVTSSFTTRASIPSPRNCRAATSPFSASLDPSNTV